MSYPQCSAPAALLAEFNAREWSGVDLIQRGASTVAAPVFSGLAGGIYDDALDFLNGRGVPAAETLGAQAAAKWATSGAAGTVAIGIDGATGRIFVESTAADFEISPGLSLDPIGFDGAGHGLVGGAAPFRRLAPSPFQLGQIDVSELALVIDPAGGLAFTVGNDRWTNDIITALRPLGSGDADDRAPDTCLQHLDAAAHHPSVRWGIDRYGHAVVARSTADTDPIVWLSSSFRDRLGFAGDEVESATGLVSILRARRPMPGVIVFEDGLDEDVMRAAEIGSATELIGHAAAGVHITTMQLARIAAYVTGPAAARDTHQHFLRRFLPYVPRGRRVTLYRMWGDPRRRRWLHDVTSTAPAHDLVYTAAADGYRGRVDAHRAAADSDGVSVSWDSGVMQQARISMLLREG